MIVGDVMMCGGEDEDYRKSHAHISRWNLSQKRICHQAAFVRRSVFDRCGGFDERHQICADHEFFVRAMWRNATLQHVPRVIAEFRPGGASTLAAEKSNSETRDFQRRLPVQNSGATSDT
jgi:hypothetical protein